MASTPHSSSIIAMARVSWSFRPPGMPSWEEMRKRIGKSGPTLARTSSMTLLGKTQAVGEDPSVLIDSLVGVGGHELGDEVSVPAVDLHAVKPRLLDAERGVAEPLDHLADLRDGELVRAFPGCPGREWRRGRRPGPPCSSCGWSGVPACTICATIFAPAACTRSVTPGCPSICASS